MQVDVTSYESIIVALALILVTVFSLAASSDRHWRRAWLPRDSRFGHKHSLRPERDDSDDKDMTSNLYLRYADLSARSLGTADKQIRVHGQKSQNVEDE